MQLVLCLVSVILISGLVGVDSLQCYFCGDCPKPTDADLVTCGDAEPTVAPPATTLTPPGTTAAPSETTAPLDTTVVLPDTTVALPETTVALPETTVALPETTVASPETTVASPQTVTAQENNEEQDALNLPGRSKRSILSIMSSNTAECNCKNESSCNCGKDIFSSRISQREDVNYICFKAEDNGIIYRGCAPASIGCNFTEAVNVTSCITCDTDKCNGSYTIHYSTVMLFVSICLMLVK